MRDNAPIIFALTLVMLAFAVILALGLSVFSGVTGLFDAPASMVDTAREGDAGLAVLVPTPTPAPALLPTPSPTPPPTATPAFLASAARVELTGLSHAWQTWNNCGPATLAMNLGYFGAPVDQAAVGAVLRRNADDKNVGPHELAAFARREGFQAQVRVNGNAELLRTLLSNGIPVLVETWLEEEDGSGLGHYRLLTGYDDAAGHWIAYDSYDSRNLIAPGGEYRGIRLGYAELDRLWRVFNHTYVLVYPQAQEAAVAGILATVGQESLTDTAAMWRNAADDARTAVAARPDDPFHWFNLGTNLLATGDASAAADAFDRARALGLPWRMLWYQFGPLDAYWQMGRHQEVLELTQTTIESGAPNEEIYFWQGKALASLGRLDEARAAWATAQQLNPDYLPVQQALAEVRGNAGG